jgi:hypothetical protein
MTITKNYESYSLTSELSTGETINGTVEYNAADEITISFNVENELDNSTSAWIKILGDKYQVNFNNVTDIAKMTDAVISIVDEVKSKFEK